MSVMMVRRRATTQRALRWTGDNGDEVREFLGDDLVGWRTTPDGLVLLIRTMENRGAPFEARPGSVLMEGSTRGEHWAVDGGVFTDTYRLRGIARVRAWIGGWRR